MKKVIAWVIIAMYILAMLGYACSISFIGTIYALLAIGFFSLLIWAIWTVIS